MKLWSDSASQRSDLGGASRPALFVGAEPGFAVASGFGPPALCRWAGSARVRRIRLHPIEKCRLRRRSPRYGPEGRTRSEP